MSMISYQSLNQRDCVDIYANDNNTNIVPINNHIYGRFQTDFKSLILLKSNDKVYDNIPF